ncbi:MAG TPA: AlkA N-terminal domain-containing protein [Aldersonia sp.]
MTICAPRSVGLDFDTCYRAVSARDPRFDGQFVTAVRSTGIYCRPSCPARTPKPANVTFLPTAAAAHRAGFRACRRCLPDAAPGSPAWNVRSDVAARTMRLITAGAVERDGVAGLAAAVGYSPRQLNRVLTAELGAGPLALARAHRAQLARVLIQTTAMPFADVAFAAGFTSIRQFNDTIREVFATTPSALRVRGSVPTATTPGAIVLRLPYRAPLNRAWLAWFLTAHAVPGLEHHADGVFRRVLPLPHGPGTVAVELCDGHVRTDLSLADLRDLAAAVALVRHLLDLDADPQAVDDALACDPALASAVAAAPGIRVPGCVDGTELLIRTMIGQQVSVAAAVTHTATLVAALGANVTALGANVTALSANVTALSAQLGGLRAFPDAAAIAEHGADVLRGPRRRVAAIVGAARAIADGTLVLHAGRDRADLRSDLLALRGVGPWTADYVAMRMLADPDTLLDTDLVVRAGAALLRRDLADTRVWAPWRSYATMHLWRTAIQARG